MTVSKVGLGLTLVRKKKSSPWANGLAALVRVTRTLPLPSDLFLDGFKFFGDYSDQVVKQTVAQEGDDAKAVPDSEIELRFSPNGQCGSGEFDSSGTVAVVLAQDGDEKDGIIDINRTDDYCLDFKIIPAFEILFAKKDPTGSCPAKTKYKRISNDYYGFYLNAVNPSLPLDQTTVRQDQAPTYTASVSSPGEGSISRAITKTFGLMGYALSDFTAKVHQGFEKSSDMTGEAPFGHIISKHDNQITSVMTGKESIAADVIEALKRCKANGIEAEKCLTKR